MDTEVVFIANKNNNNIESIIQENTYKTIVAYHNCCYKLKHFAQKALCCFCPINILHLSAFLLQWWKRYFKKNSQLKLNIPLQKLKLSSKLTATNIFLFGNNCFQGILGLHLHDPEVGRKQADLDLPVERRSHIMVALWKFPTQEATWRMPSLPRVS